MAKDYSLEGLREFLDYVGNHGLIKSTTASGYRVAVGKIEDDLLPEEASDVRQIDVPAVFTRYANKNKLKVSPSTLKVYQGRVESAIKEFVLWRDDPTGYKPKVGRRTSSSTKKKKPTGTSEANGKPEPEAEEIPATEEPGRKILTLPFPLRGDFLASVQIPRDLTALEAERLAAFVRTLALDFKPGE